MRHYRTLLPALALVAALALPTTTQAQQPSPDPATVAAEEAARQAAAAAGPRFVPVAEGAWAPCQNEPTADERIAATVPPGVDLARFPNAAGWQSSAPRAPIARDDQAALTLRDKVGTQNRMVYADVYRPDGTVARAGSALFGDAQARLSYPAGFSSGAPLTTGVYTVVWRDTITDRFIACDGFVVGPNA